MTWLLGLERPLGWPGAATGFCGWGSRVTPIDRLAKISTFRPKNCLAPHLAPVTEVTQGHAAQLISIG
jgi:hypothetical protein